MQRLSLCASSRNRNAVQQVLRIKTRVIGFNFPPKKQWFNKKIIQYQ